jgi:Flp pilus assembly protein TadD
VRGDRLRAQQRFEQAEDAYRESIRLDPSDPVVYNDLGRTLSYLDRLMDAEKEFRRAIKLAPDYAEARQNLCHALHLMGRYADCAEACDEASGFGACCRTRTCPPPGQARGQKLGAVVATGDESAR